MYCAISHQICLYYYCAIIINLHPVTLLSPPPLQDRQYVTLANSGLEMEFANVNKCLALCTT